MGLLLGAIGDDVTGSTDLALMLGKQGMSVVQYIGIPDPKADTKDAQAAVIALKTRTAPVDEAVRSSLEACRWLLDRGAQQIYFKYCSTFDSTEEGNIGAVAEALLEKLAGGVTVFCPSFPANRRTLYQGHLFVGEKLLSETGMREHPLTPMRDSNLVRFLGKQVGRPEAVGLAPLPVVEEGAGSIQEEIHRLAGEGMSFILVDALTNRHLLDIGKACKDLKLVTGGSGLAMGLPANFREAGLLKAQGGLIELPKLEGGAAVLAGSCSEATREQVAYMARHYPALAVDPLSLAESMAGAIKGDRPSEGILKEAVVWAKARLSQGPVLIYSTAGPKDVARVQERLGQREAGELVEEFFAELSVTLGAEGVRKLIVAGGETSGAVLGALGVKALRIGPEIAPGVPWSITEASPAEERPVMCLACKSGNFGDEDFFLKALKMLP